MNILIIGAGAIGIALGASLSNGNNIDFLATARTKKAIDEGGVARKGLFGDAYAKKEDVVAYTEYGDLPKNKYDYVIVASKTNVNEQIGKELNSFRTIFKSGGIIVIMQNGLGNNEPFEKYFDNKMIYNARVITGFERVELNVSNVTVHNAPVLLGTLYSNDLSVLEPLCSAMCSSGIPTEVTDDVSAALWAKLLYNTTLNPLGAIVDSSYGELYESEYAKNIMERLVCESYAVMNAVGATTYQKSADEYIKALYNELIPNTYSHHSSTLQDIKKKQKTEIETLNGCIIRLGEKNKVPTPCHRMIYNIIRAMEEKF